jgi:hypothetical protein
MLLLLEQGVHLFAATVTESIFEGDDHKFTDGSLFDAGIVFGFLEMQVHYVKVGQCGQTCLPMHRNANVLLMPLMTLQCAS